MGYRNKNKKGKDISSIIRDIIINESFFGDDNNTSFSGKTIISVDIQPEYMGGIYFDINDWVDFINMNYSDNRIIFLYNGTDTVGGVSEGEYIEWLVYDLGIDEDVINSSIFYDKGYAFFRYCIDEGIDDDVIVNLVRFMIDNDINDSRDLNGDMWDSFMEKFNYNDNDVRDLLEDAGDMINIPDLMDFLSPYSNIILMGGGIDECLKEVEIALMALNKDYNTLDRFIY